MSGYHCISPGLECQGFRVELQRSLYTLPITGQLHWVKVLYSLFKCFFPTWSLAARTIPSHTEIRSSMIPIFYLLQFCSWSFTMTTSPLPKGVVWPLCFTRCCSLNPRKYSVVHLVYKACLHLCRYVALLHRSNSLRWCSSSSGSWFHRRNSSELGVSAGNCMTSLT